MTNSIKGTHLEDVGLINLPSDWDIVEIQDLLSSDRGISVGVMYPGEHDPKGIPLVKVGDLTSNSINIYPDFYITPEKHYEYRRTAFEGGELLVTLVGALGHCAVVPESMRGWNAARAIAVLRLKNSQDAEFIRFCLLSPPLNKLINVWANTSVQATINLKEIKKLPIPFPEIKERTNIVDFLSCLDRKISNLRQQNKTLESIAQTLFKHWFVDFEFPNEDGKPYKSSGGAMVRSDFGDIPVGWTFGKLGDEFDIVMGQSPAGSSYNQDGDGLIFFQGRTDFGFRFPSVRLFTSEPKRIANKLDVLVSVRAPVGDINVASDRCCIGRGLAAVSGKYQAYCLHKLKSYRKFFDVFESEGTVFGSLNKQNFNDLDSVIPNEEILNEFNFIISPVDRKVFINEQQIQTLTKTRDRLLPKLMSGQLRIPE